MRTLFILLASCLSCLPSLAVETLAFDPSPTTNVTYKLYWGTNTAAAKGSLLLGTNQVVALTNGPWGAYYFVVTALSTNDVESEPSNAILATNKPASPLKLRMVPFTNVVYLDATFDGSLTWQRVAVVTNDPALLAQQRGQMFRARGIRFPPLP